MEIDYENSEIQKFFSDLCDVQNSKNLLQRKIGQQLARKSKQRIDQLKSSATFQKYLNLHLGNPHSLTGNMDRIVSCGINTATAYNPPSAEQIAIRLRYSGAPANPALPSKRK